MYCKTELEQSSESSPLRNTNDLSFVSLLAIPEKGIRGNVFFEVRSVWKSSRRPRTRFRFACNERRREPLVFDLRYIGQEDITAVYRMKILKTRRGDDLRSRRARKDEAVGIKTSNGPIATPFSPLPSSSRAGSSTRSCYRLIHLLRYSRPQCINVINPLLIN